MGDSNDITEEKLGEFKYLEKVIKESLRRYPSVPIIGRVLEEDITLGGYYLPKGTNLEVAIYQIQNNPRLWDNPQKFDPERWEDPDAEQKNPFSYIPFSAGLGSLFFFC